MDRLIAYCGLDCKACPGLKATRDNDDELRAKTAAEWSKMYGAEIKPEHINCTGCTVDGPHIPHWDECGIRKCAQTKGAATCAHCSDYACEQLEQFFKLAPANRTALDAIRAGL